MRTLKDYAETKFPNHVVETPDGDAPLTDHTAVAHALAGDDVVRTREQLRQSMPAARIVIATVQPTPPTVLPTGGEDKEGVLDLPKRRVATAGVVGGVAIGALIGLIVGFASSLAAGVIVGIFAAAIAGAASAIAGGGARFAGQRAWEQRNMPDQTVTLIAALTTDESDAACAAAVMERSGISDVRIVSSDGAWHSPNT